MQFYKKLLLFSICIIFLIANEANSTIHTITIGNNFFSPLGTIAEPGDTVRWIWVGGIVSHSTTSLPASPKTWNSGITNVPGFTFDLVFSGGDGPGPFPYLCTVHPFTMIDTIFISEPADSDGDGLTDTDEISIGTNPLLSDSDADGINDFIEVGSIGSPTDTDNDGIINALDTDDDNDGVLTISDNCPLIANPLQEDSNTNGIGDACEECCIGISGNVNGDPGNATDVSDLVFLVAFSFQGGNAPPCPEEADVNGSGAIDVSDLVFLVAFSFQGGPTPAACL